MDIYTARQPIFNLKQNVIAYELLFRDGPENFFQSQDGHEATAKLIARTHLSDNIKLVTSNKPALINFTHKCLVKGLPFILNNKDCVVEIVETVEPNDEVYALCKRLKRAGYLIALDDFQYSEKWDRFFPLVKIIKIDVQRAPLHTITDVIKHLKVTTQCKLLAEKVETHEEYELAKKLGFNLFQGYFFCKPQMQRKRDVESNEAILLMLHNEVSNSEMDIEKISSLFKQDSSLTYKLLKYINSGTFKTQQNISSVKQAVVYLGINKIRQIVSVLVTSILAKDKPAELTKLSMVRAKFAETVIKDTSPALADSAFLVGIFSLLDAILDKSIHDIIEPLPLEPHVKEALLDTKCRSELACILRVNMHLEKGNWELAEMTGLKLGLNKHSINNAYKSAIRWSEQYMG
mgnify:CR=1 FL=1